MATPDVQRDPWRAAARATGSLLPGSSAPVAILGSVAALIDHLIAAQTRLIGSYLRVGSSVARRSRSATPTAATQHQRPDDEPASAPSDPAPAPDTDAIEARAYELFVRRGDEPGNPVDDWRRAETELRAEMTG